MPKLCLLSQNSLLIAGQPLSTGLMCLMNRWRISLSRQVIIRQIVIRQRAIRQMISRRQMISGNMTTHNL